jgi:SET domain
VYADRDFVAGEPLVAYDLQPIDEAEYRALPAEDRLFVHSYGGRRYLYPAPARFVNPSDDPTCFEDFDRCCYVALRDIAKGEPITIDATHETAHELATFLDAYSDASRSRSNVSLAALIDQEAVHWNSGVAYRGRDAAVAELLVAEIEPLSGVEWLVGTGRWEAVCSAVTIREPPLHLTMLLKAVQGNWQLVYLHVG